MGEQTTNKKILFCRWLLCVRLEIATLHLLYGLKENGYDVRCMMNGWNDGVFKKNWKR
jgi:hypothetical protein